MQSSRWKITIKYLGVLLFFVPMVFVKAMGMGSSDIVAVVATIIALASSLFAVNRMGLSSTEKMFWSLSFGLGLLLMITSGKYIIFLSIYSLFLIYKIDTTRLVDWLVKVCWISLVALIIASLSNFSVETRFVGGEYVEITKRSNILFVVYFMLFNLYLLKKQQVKIKDMLMIGLLGVILFEFTFSRTGLVCLCVELFLLLLLKNKAIRNSKWIEFMICYSPIFLFSLVIFVSYYFSSFPVFEYVNRMMQHRLSLGNAIVNMYPVTFWGQRVVTSYAEATYLVMDNTYLNLLINYGIVLSLLWVALNVGTLKFLYKKKMYIGICIILAYSVYGLAESFVIVSFLNVSFFLYSKYLYFCLQSRKNNIHTAI